MVIILFSWVNFANISMSHSLAAHPAWWRLLKCCFFVGLLLFARRLSHVSCSNERMGAVNWRAGEVVGWWTDGLMDG